MFETPSEPEPSVLPLASTEISRKQRVVAVLLSALFPGSGQFLLKRRRIGTVLLLAFVLLLCGFWPLRLLCYYDGFLGLFSGWILLYLYAACAAALTRRGGIGLSKWWLLVILPITMVTLSLLGGVLTRASGFRSFAIPSASMEETLLPGDHIVVGVWRYRQTPPTRREVVVFRRDNLFLIKRVIAVGGDSIEGREGAILVNGKALYEPYIQHTGQPDVWMNNFGPINVPTGNLFVMGDNRDVSFDSRSEDFGLVLETSVIGTPLYVFGSDRPGKVVH